MRSQRDLKPVGDMLVSYSAAEMPTATIEDLATEIIHEHATGERPTFDALLIYGWLLRIALQKIRALESAR